MRLEGSQQHLKLKFLMRIEGGGVVWRFSPKYECREQRISLLCLSVGDCFTFMHLMAGFVGLQKNGL